LILITLYNEDCEVLQEQNYADRGSLRPEDVEKDVRVVDVRVVVILLANASTTLDLYLLMMLYCIVL
jgi:hypothetical protein